MSTHNDLLPEIFSVAEGSLVKTITSIATMVQAKNGKDQYPVSACVGCMMSALARSDSHPSLTPRTRHCRRRRRPRRAPIAEQVRVRPHRVSLTRLCAAARA